MKTKKTYNNFFYYSFLLRIKWEKSDFSFFVE